MQSRNIRRVIATGLLAIALTSAYGGLAHHRNSRLEQIGREFPTHVKNFETKYGSFVVKPKLRFEPLGHSNYGKAERDTVVISDSIIIHLIDYSENHIQNNSVRHELGHIYTIELLDRIKMGWNRYYNGNWHAQKGMEKIAFTLNEGISEYVAISLGGKGNSSLKAPYEFVKPLLDKFGLKEGSEKMWKEPPTKDELKTPQSYYRRLGM